MKGKSAHSDVLVALMLGSNRGDRQEMFDQAIAHIRNRVGKVMKQSTVYETAPWGLQDQPLFLNQALLVETALPPEEVLRCVLDIETNLGRDRSMHPPGGEREIDIDVLFYGNQIVQQKDLQIPHPEIQNRRFVLTPLNELIPNFTHPLLSVTISSLLDKCEDVLKVNKPKRMLKKDKK